MLRSSDLLKHTMTIAIVNARTNRELFIIPALILV